MRDRSIELELSDDALRALEAAAVRQGVDPEEMLKQLTRWFLAQPSQLQKWIIEDLKQAGDDAPR